VTPGFILVAERRCVPILVVGFVCCCLTVWSQCQSSGIESFSDKDLMLLGKPGELDRVYFQVKPLEQSAMTFK